MNEILTSHTAPELEYLEVKWAAQGSYSVVAVLLHDVLPVDQGLRQETIRQHVFATAERLEAQLGPEQLVDDGSLRH